MRSASRKITGSVIAFILVGILGGCGGGSTPAPTIAPSPVSTLTSAPVPTTSPSIARTTSMASPIIAGTTTNSASVALTDATSADAAMTSDCLLADDPYMTGEQVVDAIGCANTRFSWPDGYGISMDFVTEMMTADPTALTENGYEFTFLSIWNQCAWYSSWLDARSDGDAVAEQEALRIITDVIPRFPDVIPDFPSNVWTSGSGIAEESRSIANKALLGDPSAVQSFVEFNCSGTYHE